MVTNHRPWENSVLAALPDGNMQLVSLLIVSTRTSLHQSAKASPMHMFCSQKVDDDIESAGFCLLYFRDFLNNFIQYHSSF